MIDFKKSFVNIESVVKTEVFINDTRLINISLKFYLLFFYLFVGGSD